MKKLIVASVLCASVIANANPALLLYAGQAAYNAAAREKAAAAEIKEAERRELARLAQGEELSKERRARAERETEERQLANKIEEGSERALALASAREDKERAFPDRGQRGLNPLGTSVLELRMGDYKFDRSKTPKPPKPNAPTYAEELANLTTCVSTAVTTVLGESSLVILKRNKYPVIYTSEYIEVLSFTSFDPYAHILRMSLKEGALSVSSALSLSAEIIRSCKVPANTPAVEKITDYDQSLEEEAFFKHTLGWSFRNSSTKQKVVFDKYTQNLSTNEHTLRKFTTCVQSVFAGFSGLEGTVSVEEASTNIHRIVWTKNWVRVATSDYWMKATLPASLYLFNFQISKERADVLAATLRDKCSPK